MQYVPVQFRLELRDQQKFNGREPTEANGGDPGIQEEGATRPCGIVEARTHQMSFLDLDRGKSYIQTNELRFHCQIA